MNQPEHCCTTPTEARIAPHALAVGAPRRGDSGPLDRRFCGPPRGRPPRGRSPVEGVRLLREAHQQFVSLFIVVG
jgi:hypothetical protein